MSRDLPDDLAALGDRLRDERPQLAAPAADRVAARVARAADAPRRRRSAHRPSLAVALCLALGLVMSGAGTGMAISGLASTGDTAVQAQYPVEPVTGAGAGTPSVAADAAPVVALAPGPQPTVRGARHSDAPKQSPSQASRQLAAAETNATLPFTGLAAIPVAAAGLVLLGIGLLLRRRSRDAPEPV